MTPGHGAARTQHDLLEEIAGLTARLREAEDLVLAIRSGGVDALVVAGSDGDRVFTLTGSDHAYRILIEGMNECALTIAPDGAILYCNRRTADLLGIPPDCITGASILQFVSQAEALRFEALLQRATLTPAKDEIVLQTAHGVKVPTLCSLSSLSPHGIPALGMVITDLTEQKRSQELLAVRERLQLAQAAGRIGTYELDLRSGRIYWTAELEALYGLEPGGFDGTWEGWLGRIHPDDRERFVQAMDRASTTGALDVEFRALWPDGSFRWLSGTGRVQTLDGRAVRHLGVNGDIGARKAAEEALALKAAELERSNADLKQFAMVASHDLQEPLRMITSYLGLLERRYAALFDDTAKAYLGFAADGAERLSGMITSLLAYSSLNASSIQLAEVPLEEPVRDALANLAGPIAEREAVVEWDALPTVRADRTHLTRLLQNLVGNGIKFCRGTPTVRLAARRGDGEWIVSVTDNGIGIPTERRDALFQMFQRLHGADEFPGSGIGLASCRRIVERHGGRIWVESQPGAGSTFSFSLPG